MGLIEDLKAWRAEMSEGRDEDWTKMREERERWRKRRRRKKRLGMAGREVWDQ